MKSGTRVGKNVHHRLAQRRHRNELRSAAAEIAHTHAQHTPTLV
jgi:hypothetical protein